MTSPQLCGEVFIDLGVVDLVLEEVIDENYMKPLDDVYVTRISLIATYQGSDYMV